MNVDDFLKVTGNQYGSIAEDDVCGDVKYWIDTGSYIFNALISGSLFKGIPSNKIVGLAGAESVGKSFFALATCKFFLERDPKAIVVFFETEGALTKEILVSRGIDLKRFIILPVATVQEFKTQAIRIVDKYLEEKSKNPVLFVLDSPGNLSTTKEMEDSSSGSDTKDMTRAQMLKAAFRILTLKLGMAEIPLIFTNHVYAKIGSGPYAGNEQSGGTGSKYAASITVMLTKAKEKDGDEQIGNVITATINKSRITREGTRVKTLIKFDGGLSRYYGLLDIAEKAGIFKKVSTRYELPDGSKVFGKAIDREPEKYFTDEVLAQINDYTEKNFRFGVGSEPEEFINQEDDNLDNQNEL